jgi:NAD(P)-dependent dehydrogenase (short-subunit alcohol dehydrogenase family)
MGYDCRAKWLACVSRTISGITANVVAPGMVETDLSARVPAAQRAHRGADTARPDRHPRRVARAVALLAR